MLMADGGFWNLWYLSGDLAAALEDYGLDKLPARIQFDHAEMCRAGDAAKPEAVVGLARAAQELAQAVNTLDLFPDQASHVAKVVARVQRAINELESE